MPAQRWDDFRRRAAAALGAATGALAASVPSAWSGRRVVLIVARLDSGRARRTLSPFQIGVRWLRERLTNQRDLQSAVTLYPP